LIDVSKITPSDWIAIYAAVLSTIIALVASLRFVVRKIKTRKERGKFQTDLYFLRKVDRNSKKVHPIVVVLLANLGSEELFGIRNRLLPIVLETGQTADLPMVGIGILTRIKNLKIWLTDFEDQRYYVAEKDIKKVRHDVEKFLQEHKGK
jgi:hypothetical protein